MRGHVDVDIIHVRNNASSVRIGEAVRREFLPCLVCFFNRAAQDDDHEQLLPLKSRKCVQRQYDLSPETGLMILKHYQRRFTDCEVFGGGKLSLKTSYYYSACSKPDEFDKLANKSEVLGEPCSRSCDQCSFPGMIAILCCVVLLRLSGDVRN